MPERSAAPGHSASGQANSVPAREPSELALQQAESARAQSELAQALSALLLEHFASEQEPSASVQA